MTIETKKLEISKDLLKNVGMTYKFVFAKPTITGKKVKSKINLNTNKDSAYEIVKYPK